MANLLYNLAQPFSDTKQYTQGAIVIYNDRMYEMTADEYTPGPFDPEKFTERFLSEMISGKLNSNLFNNSKKIIEVSTAGKGQIYVKAEFDCEYVKATKDTVPVHNDGSVYPTTLTNVDSGEVTTVTTSATKLPCKGTYIYQLNQANLAQGYFSCVDIIPCNAND